MDPNSGFCLIINLRHTSFLQFLGGGDPFQLGSWSEAEHNFMKSVPALRSEHLKRSATLSIFNLYDSILNVDIRVLRKDGCVLKEINRHLKYKINQNSDIYCMLGGN